MAPQQKGIGLIGLSAKYSWASISHFIYLRQTSHYKITALQNSSKSSAQAAAEKYSLGPVATYDNPSAIASDPNVDIVAVSVNVPEHYSLLKPAIEAGKDVFVEWPLARNLAEAEELTKLAAEKRIRTSVGLQARQSPSVLKAKEYVQAGKLGKILGTTMYGHGLVFGPAAPESMRYLLNVESGANLLTIPFGHAVDALCYVLGEIKELSATLSNHRPEITILDKDFKPIGTAKKTSHDYISITGRLESGANVDVTYAAANSRTGREFYWEINGTEGSLVLEGPANGGIVGMYQPTVKFVSAEEGAKLENVEVEIVDEHPNLNFREGDFSFGVGKAWDAWAGEGLEQGYSVVTFEDALVRHKMIDAIYRSAEKGTRERYL